MPKTLPAADPNPRAGVGASAVVGREDELAAVEALLGHPEAGPGAFLLEGEAGIGKTTVWRAGLSIAQRLGFQVLRSRPAEPDVALAYACLGDLLSPVVESVLGDLPDPQRRALEVALLLADPHGRATSPRTVAAGVLGTIRALARQTPVLVGVDDVQWLDRASADALAWALRRLDAEPVVALVACRLGVDPPDPLALSGAFEPGRMQTLLIRGMDRDAIARLVEERLGWAPPHPVLRVIHERSGGNPFFALELARAAIEGGGRLDPAIGIPAPEDLASTLRTRIGKLSPAAREALLAVSATGTPTVELLERVVQRTGDLVEVLAEARRADLVEVHGGVVAFTHPLYASAVYSEASATERRAVHARLAGAIHDPEERARHLALSTSAPDPAAAAVVGEAARHAHARGAEWAAAELCQLAADLTPGSPEAGRLLAQAAGHLFRAGDRPAGVHLLEAVIEATAHGARRGDLLLRLAQQRWQDDPLGTVAAAREALAEDAASDGTRAKAHLVLAQTFNDLTGQEDVRRELAAAIACAGSAGDGDLLAQALATEAFFDPGPEIDPTVFERAERAIPDDDFLSVADRPTWNLACLLVVDDRLDEARPIISSLIREARDSGDEPGEGMSHMLLGMLEERAGNLERSRDEFDEMRRLGTWPMEHVTAAYVDALLGDLDEARRKLDRALVGGEEMHGATWAARVRAMRGFLDVSAGNVERAADAYTVAWETLSERLRGSRAPRLGYHDAGDAVEAFVQAGDVDHAGWLTTRLEDVAAGLPPCRVVALAHRSRGLILASTGNLGAAIAELEQAMIVHESVPVPFERARTLLVLGSVRRRAKQKRAAREALEEALGIFERIGTPLWAERARRELASIGGRAPSTGGLSPTEARVARLAAAGRTNREIAGELFLSARTVESHLSRVYAKLGVRSRTELASALDPATPSR